MYRTNAHRPPPPPRTPRAWPRVVLYSTLALVVGSVVAALLVHAVSAARSTIPTSVIPLPTPASPAPPPTPLFTETSPIGGMDTVEPPLHGVETKVYWTVPDEGLVKRVSWMGGSPEVVASAERRPTDLIAHRDAVLWVDEGVDAGQGPHGRGIKRLLPDGSLRQIVAGHVSPGTKLAISPRLQRAVLVAASPFLTAAPDSSALQLYQASLGPDQRTPQPRARALPVAGGWRRVAAETLRLIGFMFLALFALALIYAPQLAQHPEISLSVLIRRLPDWRVSVSVAFVLAALMCSWCCQLASRIDGER